MFTETEAIRGKKPGMTRGVEVIFLEEDWKRSARDFPVMLFLPKTPSL